MSGTIIVGVADAAASQRAVEWAAQRSRVTGERIVLLSVVGGAVGAVGEDAVVARVVDATADALRPVAEQLAAEGLAIEVSVSHGDPVSRLVDASADATVLVLGAQPRGRGRGPHAFRIAAGAHCPVVAIPEGDGAARRGVVVGVDGSETSNAAIAFAAAEAARLGEPLTVLAAWMPVAVPGDFGVYPDVYLADLQGLTQGNVDRVTAEIAAAHPELVVTGTVGEGDPATVINEAAATASLVVVGSHGRTGFARFLLGSVSEEVLSHLVTATAVVR